MPNLACATKACLPSPCEGRTGGPDYEKCWNAAAWVAVGTVSDVVHHKQGDPLHKDFAEFTFNVQSWEKGAEPGTKKMRLQVGWCESPVPLPPNTDGPFRFYGPAAPADPTVRREYLYFQRLAL